MNKVIQILNPASDSHNGKWVLRGGQFIFHILPSKVYNRLVNTSNLIFTPICAHFYPQKRGKSPRGFESEFKNKILWAL